MELRVSDFDGTKLKRLDTLPVLFAASWCPFCRQFRPIFESVLGAKGIRWRSVDMSDLESPLWDTFDVRVVPTVIVFKEGRAVFRSDGVLGRGLPAEVMEEIVHEISVGRPAVAH